MRSRGNILIVDDEANARSALSEMLHDEGFATETAADGFKALGKVESFGPDVVLTDLKMPGLDGLALMEKVAAVSPDTVFVVMTAFGSIANAVEAMKRGAENYLTKPLDVDAVVAVVTRALEKAKLRQETRSLRDKLDDRNAFKHVVTSDEGMKRVLDLVAQVGPSKATVLINGESGTGKELIAEALCAASPRAAKPLVRLHCAALSESLLESELFGHERGAFTGAMNRREGRFKQADGGTLFLDEVGEIPPATQVKLLRFLQEKTFERVGGNETLRVDVRIIAATNKDLIQEVKAGTFREDLYYRLNVITVDLPPLRARAGDVMELAMFFVRRYAEENHKAVTGFSDEARRVLESYDYPGNVRELENAVERAVILCETGNVEIRHLPASVSRGAAPQNELPQIPGASIAELERFAILKTLEACHGSTSRAASILGISARKIQYKLHDYDKNVAAPDE